MEESKIFLEFMKDEEGITANFVETQIQISEETGKTDEEILKIIKQVIEEFEKDNKKEGANENGSEQ